MSHFKEYLKQFKGKKIIVYIDMDGVVADYDILYFKEDEYREDIYLNKRPVKTVINILKEVNDLNNVTLKYYHVLKKKIKFKENLHGFLKI